MTACQRVREQLSRFLDNDLDAAAATRVAAHLDACAGCRYAYGELRDLRAALHTLPAPPDRDIVQARLFDRLERAVRENAVSPPRRRLVWPALRIWQPAVATLAVAGAAAGLLFLLPQSAPPPEKLPSPGAPLPTPAEMTTLFDLHDAHGGSFGGDEPALHRSRSAEAHAALLDQADAAIAGSL